MCILKFPMRARVSSLSVCHIGILFAGRSDSLTVRHPYMLMLILYTDSCQKDNRISNTEQYSLLCGNFNVYVIHYGTFYLMSEVEREGRREGDPMKHAFFILSNEQ